MTCVIWKTGPQERANRTGAGSFRRRTGRRESLMVRAALFAAAQTVNIGGHGPDLGL